MPEITDSLPDPFLAPLPNDLKNYPRGYYDDYPAFEPEGITIDSGYSNLGEKIKKSLKDGLRVLVIDGFHGVDWNRLKKELNSWLTIEEIPHQFYKMEDCYAPAEKIDKDIKPFLGENDSIFGSHYPFGMEVFFDPQKTAEFRIIASKARARVTKSISIFYGCGAGLIELWDQLWYLDIPKNNVQFLAKDWLLSNMGTSEIESFEKFYKRSYFVDWPALNRLKRVLLPQIDLFLDLGNADVPKFISGNEFRSALHQISENAFRVRPWFLPGPWGGKYTQGHMGQDPAQPNMAWSYEIIVPENGIVFKKKDNFLECSFDCLMYQENKRVLGEEATKQFIYEWPIRLDYLDTIDGGNLSLQCHPQPDYIREYFGETYTQDETYYMANTKPNARVYLGLTEDCDLDAFRKDLEKSQRTGVEVDIDKYVNSEPAKPHDLFLIPNGTVHCSGKGNLVLEISATPYIFTFKLYDYLRKDLNGNLRPINIEHGFKNIRFERRTSWVRENLIAKPRLIDEGENWEKFVLYDSPFTFYNVYRVHFTDTYEFDTDDHGFAVNLVQGKRITVKAKSGKSSSLSYLESMIIPAAAEKVSIKNDSDDPCILVQVKIKSGIGKTIPLNQI
jgi:mannose-6-phosphate isomerase class I